MTDREDLELLREEVRHLLDQAEWLADEPRVLGAIIRQAVTAQYPISRRASRLLVEIVRQWVKA